jgi:tetratricopeptide (TPR) repeat protein
MDLHGRTIAIIGRLDRLPWKRLAPTVARYQITISRHVSGRTGAVVIGHGATTSLRSGKLAHWLAVARDKNIDVFSEHAFLRAIGMLGALDSEPRPFSAGEVQARSGMPRDALQAVTLFDVIEEEGAHYCFRDLKAARDFARFMKTRTDLADAIDRALTLRRRSSFGQHLSELMLEQEEPADPELPLGDSPESFDTVWDEAFAAHLHGDYMAALESYRRCAQMRPKDAMCLFNLANVLLCLELDAEAKTLLRRVVTIDRTFADAWLDLAELEQGPARIDLLERCLTFCPDDTAALRELAQSYIDVEDYARAQPLWERLLPAISPSDRQAMEHARRAVALCRMATIRDGRNSKKGS